MNTHALFLKHHTKPGLRDEVEAVWRRHMLPAVDQNEGHQLYVYSFGEQPDVICAFQVYRTPDDAKAFVQSQAYLDYLGEVGPLLAGDPEVEVLQPRWIKNA